MKFCVSLNYLTARLEQDPTETILCKTIQKKAREDIRKHNLDEMVRQLRHLKAWKKVRRKHSLDKNRMITILDKQCKEIQEQDNTMARIEEFYSEL